MRKHIKATINKQEIEHLLREGEIDTLFATGYRYEFAASIDKTQKSLNQQQAMAYYHAAASQGHAEAALRYGLGCERGYLANKEAVKAFQYYQRAIRLKNIRAVYEIARCYELGIGTTQDYSSAIKNYQLTVRLVQTVINKIQQNKLSLTDPHSPDLNEINRIFSQSKDKVEEISQKIKLFPKNL